ncbi:MAG: hypothetical protein ABIH52_04045 [Candidatus Aenigmatarchaeota archaeon]|nr:hypothetical protein [Nanoarchaeota archaeon]
MSEYQQELILTPEIRIERGEPVEVREDVQNSRESIMQELGLDRNDSKIAVRTIKHAYLSGREDQYAEVTLAPGITSTDCKWNQMHLHKTGDPFEAFGRETPFSGYDVYTARLADGGYVHFSTFGLVLGFDGENDFDKSFVLLAEKRGKNQQQRGSISISNQGYEAMWREQRIGPEEIPLTTADFMKAISYDSVKTLRIDENQLVGYQNMGLAFMPGSIDAGGLVVACISYSDLKKAYDKTRSDADKHPENAWKIPVIIPVNELPDFLRSSEHVNSLLKESALGRYFHDDMHVLGSLYESALSRGFDKD